MKFFTLVLFILFGYVAEAQRTLLHCGTLIDGLSDRAMKEMTIVVEGNRIIGVEKGFSAPGKDDKVIDLTRHSVMPGLMDMHVHLEGETSPDSYLKRFQQDPADIAYDAAVHAKTTLMAGFTTVRDLGGTGVNTALRDAVNAGKVPGPRIFSAGKSIATTGGHADPTNGYRSDLVGDPGPKEGVINGPYDARKAVRQRYKDGSNVIKITSTGGVLSLAKDGSGPQFQMDELEAIIETAREYGMTTAAHAHGDEGMRRAVEAGITSIEHGTFMSTATMDLMKEKGTYYVPTISAGMFVAEKAKIPGYYPPIIVPKALEVGPQISNTFAQAYKRGVKIAFGTDAAVFPHGENGKEFGYMVDAGMPPMETIKSATIEAAKLLEMEEQLGTIESGKLADIVATMDNPLENISTMENVVFVMKDGVVYKD
ncbi:amidohydrolase family protein [Fulvivirga sp. 1062]|uniref:Amidohydrolase family protein n=2 Tax=Fulvivirga sedimenti TaxID=2879465 RepID=A0A9X1L170_9BACT|nr:amidohydrolase family protein [Fulvivirga sedimenti]MCA6077912.1 amidohydrolase family protein [Fulvivirga sedimenti]